MMRSYFSISDDSDSDNNMTSKKQTPIVITKFEKKQAVLETPFLTKNNLTDSESDTTLRGTLKLSQRYSELPRNIPQSVVQDAFAPFAKTHLKSSFKSNNSSNRYSQCNSSSESTEKQSVGGPQFGKEDKENNFRLF